MKKSKTEKFLLDVLFIAVGSAIYAVEVNMFTAPNNIAPGGITGLATVINYATNMPIGIMVILLNIPIIIWAVIEIGYKLVFKTIIAIAFSSVFIDVFAFFVIPYQGDMILVSIFGGVLEGIGLSLVFIRGATTGGTDMIARLLGKRFRHLSLGKLMLAVDGCVVLIAALVYRSIDSAMYACIVIFVSTSIIDAVLYGTDAGTGKTFFIFSVKNREIGDRIMKELDRGVTYIDSTGGYTNEKGEMLLCAVRRYEVYKINQIIREEDKNAFVIVGDSGEISGEGFKAAKSDDKSLKDWISSKKTNNSK